MKSVAFLSVFLLWGGKPAERDASPELVLESTMPWASLAAEPPGPTIESRDFETGSGWRFTFEPGSQGQAGYAQVPVPGTHLGDVSTGDILVEYRGGGSDEAVHFVVIGSRDHRRFEMPLSHATWSTLVVPGEEIGFVPRFLRVEATSRGIKHRTSVDVRAVGFEPASRTEGFVLPAPRRSARGLPPTGVVAEDHRLFADREPFFSFGLFMLGANRSLQDWVARAGANTIVEYGPSSWQASMVEDHLDYARGNGCKIAAALTSELHGRFTTSDVRLQSLEEHPSLLAWYLFDEPDGAIHRGVEIEHCQASALEARRRALGNETPVLLTCMNAPAMSQFAAAADIVSVDFYWPAWGPNQQCAIVHSNAEAVTEIAESSGATPFVVLQLGHPPWMTDDTIQSPETIRAQVLGALAAGVRGILMFEGVWPLRWAMDRQPGGFLWQSFLDVASEVATIGPVAARWERVPGQPTLSPAMGEVRAQAFVQDGRRWVVVVNMGATDASVELSGAFLADARELHDHHSGRLDSVVEGKWRANLPARRGHVFEVRGESGATHGPVRVEARVPAPGQAPLPFDRAVVGATLFPAPAGRPRVSVFLDDREITRDGDQHRGAAHVVRVPVQGLSNGEHRVRVEWEEGGTQRHDEWTFEVDAPRWPFRDDFERRELGPHWTPTEPVPWNHFDPEETPSAGEAEIVDGKLRIASTSGRFGVLLRDVEPPMSGFELGFEATMKRSGRLVLLRNELFREFDVATGTHQIELREFGASQEIFVDGDRVGSWENPIDHRGGALGIGVAQGTEVLLDDLRLGD